MTDASGGEESGGDEPDGDANQQVLAVGDEIQQAPVLEKDQYQCTQCNTIFHKFKQLRKHWVKCQSNTDEYFSDNTYLTSSEAASPHSSPSSSESPIKTRLFTPMRPSSPPPSSARRTVNAARYTISDNNNHFYQTIITDQQHTMSKQSDRIDSLYTQLYEQQQHHVMLNDLIAKQDNDRHQLDEQQKQINFLMQQNAVLYAFYLHQQKIAQAHELRVVQQSNTGANHLNVSNVAQQQRVAQLTITQFHDANRNNVDTTHQIQNIEHC